jgi:Cell morphogenesis N-terminal/Cell morphogenesis central region
MSPESLASAGPGVNGINGFSPIGRLDAMSPSSLGGSLSAGGVHSQNPSINSALGGPDSASGESPNGGGLGRRQAAQSRQRRGNGHNPSHSRGHSEARTPGEYALHHLLNSFVAQADHKINQCISHVGEMVTPVEQLCGPGVDQTFDQLISALGHIARQKPKPLIDSLMFWRKAKGEAATAAKQQLNQQRSANPASNALPATAPRRNTEPSQNDTGSGNLHVETDIPAASLAGPTTEEAVLAERRATVSVYLVCRVLIEIFEQSSLSAITTELAGRLEDIVFGQLKSVDPSQISSSSLRLANWRIYGQLLGHMSGVNFVSVTAKFVQELDACQKEIAKNPTSIAARDAEGRSELLILAMRHLQIKTASGSWPNSCNFVRAVANLFSIAHGQRIKQAYCQVLQSMLLSIAAEADADLGAIKWKEALEIISARLGQMLTKVRHWNNAFPLSITLLCVSSSDSFSSQWLTIISGMATKLKDRSTRGLALQAICRLTWTYMNRIPDVPPARIRKIEEIIKIALPQGKKTNLTTDAAVAEPLIQLIRVIGFRHQELCFRTIIFPLINSDLFASGRDLRVEQMEPEKMVIGIRAFLAIMLDLEKGDQGCPPFPQSFPNSSVIEPLPTSPLPPRAHWIVEAKFPTASQNDNASRLVNTSNLSEVAKQYYLRFCEILGKITILCDNTFGGQATLNEKFGGPTPKTPLSEAFSFARKEDGSTGDQKQAYYDLLHVAIQALPRCLSDHIPFTSLINLLCTGSAHIQSSIASSSAQSLRSIAKQGHAQAVAIAFPRFIFNYDSKYSTMSDEGMLGSGHIETTLTLYIELLQIWVDELRQKTIGTVDEYRDGAGAATTRAMPLEMTNVYPHVDEIEAYGLFFLCSQSRKVRAFAVKVLRMVTEFDKAMGKDEHTRIIRILEDQSDRVLDLNDDSLSVAERSRLQMGKRKNATQNTLIEICSSEVSYDSTLWYKVFPNLIRITFDMCPNAIALSRGIVCDRLLQMQNAIEYLAHDSRTPQYVAQDFRVAGRSASTSPDVLIDQWKLYLVMACVTLSSAGAQSQSQLANAAHTRKQSKSDVGSREKLSSARALFSAIIPLLSAGPDSIRNAIVLALGSIKHKLYRTLLESLQYAVTKCNDEAKARIGTHQRTPSNPQRNRSTERLRTEVTHVYKLTSSFLRDADVCNDDWILNNLVTYAKDLRIFLSDAEIQNDWEFQRLRFHYCGLMEEVFEGINRSKNPSRWLPFESRKSAFTLMEDWCGYSSNQGQIAQREDVMKQSAFAQQQETGERQNLNSAMEIEKKNLRIAALSAMAALCAGPISIKTESNAILQFHLPRMLSWIESIFATVSDKMHAIGRRALKELIVNNTEHSVIMEHSVERCYRAERPKALESYFEVVSQVLIEHKDYPLAFWRILGAVLFTLGNENRDIRMKSAHLLRTLEERQQKSSKLQDFDISISDKTTAVYKLAQFEYSKRLSKAHSELAFVIFSEFSLHFKNVSTDHQRNMVAAILPWIQTIELQVDPNGGPIAVSYMLLSNLFEITIRSSNVLHNEVQALWQALATGPHGGNVQLILDFIITLSLERREQNFVHYAKQIVVYLSATPAGARVIEFFLLQLIPKNMVNEKKPVEQVPPDMKGLPYVADLAAILPTGTKQVIINPSIIMLVSLTNTPTGRIVARADSTYFPCRLNGDTRNIANRQRHQAHPRHSNTLGSLRAYCTRASSGDACSSDTRTGDIQNWRRGIVSEEKADRETCRIYSRKRIQSGVGI